MISNVALTRTKRIAEYLFAFAAKANIERAVNLVRNEIEFQSGKTALQSYPPTVTVDITNNCQLRCPLCATGRKEIGRPQQVMPLENYTKLIREIAPRAYQVFLYCWGDPLLVKQLPEYVRIARNHNLAVTASSNLSLPLSDDQIELLLVSGPDRLLVSLDGIDKETYGYYRKGGRFELVLENVKRIRLARQKMRRKYPKLIWQFLAFSHNEQQIKKAASIYRDWGFDSFEIEKPNLPFGINDPALADKWFAKNPKLRLSGPFDIKDNIRARCFWPWRSAIINPDGGLSPCCYVSDQKHDVGNVFAQGFAAAWNSPEMQSLRKTILGRANAAPCADCSALNWDANNI